MDSQLLYWYLVLESVTMGSSYSADPEPSAEAAAPTAESPPLPPVKAASRPEPTLNTVLKRAAIVSLLVGIGLSFVHQVCV